VIERSYASGTKFRDVPVTKREKTTASDEGEMAVFMDNETYEQVFYRRRCSEIPRSSFWRT